MIDDPRKTEFLIAALKESIPFMARMTPELVRELSKDAPGTALPGEGEVMEIFYTGDYGGILCALEIADYDSKKKCVVSITHLRFNRNTPFFREIDAYQRHRVKKLKKQQGMANG